MKPVEVRERLLLALEADLVGPFALAMPGTNRANAYASTEVLPMPPSRWYFTGFLAPDGQRAPAKEDLDSHGGDFASGSEGQAEDSGAVDPEPARPVRFPASMGLSVYLPPEPASGPESLQVELTWADYQPVEIAEDTEDRKKIGWKRLPRGPVSFPVPLDEALLAEGLAVPNAAGLRLVGELRTTDMKGLPPRSRVLSLWVVNSREALERDRDRSYAFQVRLALRFEAGFLWRPNRRGEDARSDDDPRVLALLFRERKEWAVGHNTSILPPEPDADGKVRALVTTQLPRYEVPTVEHRKVPNLALGMADLAKLDGVGLSRALASLPEEYGRWIESQRRAQLDRSALEETRDQLVKKADEAKARVSEGIALLGSDAVVRDAFLLANQAMHIAAVQADSHRADKRYVDGKRPEWRPFQLAFVLMCLPSLADPCHRERRIAELIYFPTGGGKTEAYLGLVAFALILRRLHGKSRPDEGRGVSVILRYTLRLLTLDQLGRASTLICALEELRRRDPKRLGNTRFAIGLWVGKAATANRLKELLAALNDFASSREESPFPLSKCPWCGEQIRIENIKSHRRSSRASKSGGARAPTRPRGRCEQSSSSASSARRRSSPATSPTWARSSRPSACRPRGSSYRRESGASSSSQRCARSGSR
jgi:hypothetical protein